MVIRRAREGRDVGVSFVEIMVAVVLLGTIVVAALVGLRTAIIGTEVDEDSARAHAWLQAAADEVYAAAYRDCSNPYTPAQVAGFYQTAVNAATRPTEWGGGSGATITVTSVQFLSRSGSTETWGTVCATGDPDSPVYPQLVTIRVNDPDGKFTTQVEVIKSV